ncbi:MAG: valine--tRNA ligase [Calditrichaeota bacterium]|nr:MAG: valine--tRNA ligase [Calditrichota bacterium]
MQQEIPKVYAPKDVEERLYQMWLDRGFFHAEVNAERQPYTIVIPPPNVTDVLHMGHAYNNTIQDILIRFQRMQDKEALWLPGTDHAGIATQNVVERFIWNTEKKTRHDLGREKFVERVWAWREERGGRIIEQLKKMGFSCDWSRERFTMDEGMSRAVLEVFVRLYNKGLIYRGKYIINWCPRCQTALSDEEVEHQEHAGNLWYINYPVAGEHRAITVATTRPETMLGDVAVAVHPQDKRYKDLIGKTATLPILGRELQIIGDEMVEREFGTGAVKVTPAHDPNDFLIAQRHQLQAINVMNEDATMNDNAGKFAGMDRLKARKHVLQELKKGGYLEKIEEHKHSVGHCYRCNTVIEPRLSEQWFVKMKPLAEPALKVVKEGKIKLHPARWTKVFTHWLENIHDWCISRQIWWGHRIPIYTCESCNEVMASVDPPASCQKCGAADLRQDPDVLDTWFSSQLWPFATLGWPDETPDLKYFYPTDTLVTGPDIIFFWVARMVMMGLEFMGEIPFRDVYFNGIIRDAQGRKMSKSLGNGIDPLEMVEKYSADAVRFSLLELSAEGQDINLAESSFEIGRNFSNKVWNAFRFLWMNLQEADLENAHLDYIQEALKTEKLDLADRWLLSRYQKTVRRVTRSLEHFKLHEACEAVYTFFWREYCDWYLELIKPRLYSSEDSDGRQATVAVAVFVMKGILQLLHPVVPFITEEIWLKLRNRKNAESIMVSCWPVERRALIDEQVEKEMTVIQNVIGAIRNIRGEMNVAPNKPAQVMITAEDNNGTVDLILAHKPYFEHLAKVSQLQRLSRDARPKKAASAVVNHLEIFLPLEGLIDFDVEKARLEKEINRLEKQLEGLNRKLQSPEFLSKAPEAIVDLEKKKKSDFESSLGKLKANLQSLLS